MPYACQVRVAAQRTLQLREHDILSRPSFRARAGSGTSENAGISHSTTSRAGPWQREDRLKPNLASAFEMLAVEAQAMGIPKDALPRLTRKPSLEQVRQAQKQLEGIMASFQSANI